MFKVLITSLLKSVLLHQGVFAGKRSAHLDLVEFLGLVGPYTTDKELIRIGGHADGGYLIPNDLTGVEYCFSPGVGPTVAFESDLANLGIRSFLADYSVDGPPTHSEMFGFEKRFLGARNDGVFMTLESWIAKSVSIQTQDLLLQMDIEGSEYDVIIETPQAVWERFRILVIEFHELQNVFSAFSLRVIHACFEKLTQTFDIVHIHPNNVTPAIRKDGFEIPRILEITFLRKGRASVRKKTQVFPHPLDRPGVAGRRDLILAPCWYR